MASISVDLLGPYSNTQSGNQYVLTIAFMLTNLILQYPLKQRPQKM